MATVPNWIAKAVIIDPRNNIVTETVSWRATKTQVIVRTSTTGPEHRFYLDSLTPVGEPRYFPSICTHLAPPGDPQVIDARRAHAAGRARRMVLNEVEAQRLQDSRQDIETVTRKLTAIRDAATKALADLAPLL